MISEPQDSHSAVGSFPRPDETPAPRNSPIAVALAWSVVAIPALWGIYMTAMTSVQLFKPTAPAPAAHIAPAAPAPTR